ncbi:hypothetical protein VTN49DRAFT_8060 [Thermomyces lanuginosus]|mgnify:CR=1 FL=1|uniref:uncharacterized protein n=1 Tax=Thermomyces lanuginosus TaxID=5541 RepID=UPI003743E842
MGSVAPVSRGEFSYAVDSFYVESSNFQVHRRAAIDQIRGLFQSGFQGRKDDQRANWYEAQLIHYGRPPSKNKAVAKMRLLDALNAGNLVVPKGIAKTEAELKKE